MLCPECGHQNLAGALICHKCHTDIYDSLLGSIATSQLHDPADNTGPDGQPLTSLPVVLYIAHEEKPLSVERRRDIIIGRSEGDVVATVDLEAYDARARGVSRHHARLDAEAQPPTLTDLDSYNGTFLNGTKLIPQQPYPLRTGDEIRLGRLALRFYIR
ncbi:MAG: FHA domain-containing protein [Anaerolineae bacterium]|nr:FHA domain-containing protein [Anaerolineae bacterium]